MPKRKHNAVSKEKRNTHTGPHAGCQRLRAALAGVRWQRQRAAHAGRDAQALQAPKGALVVMDRGIATQDNITYKTASCRLLLAQGYRYLVVSREPSADLASAMTVTTATQQTVHLHKVLSEDGQEARLYCYSEAREQKEKAIAERFAKRFENALTTLSEGLSRPRTQKRIDKIWQRIGRLKEKSHGVAQHYDIDVTSSADGTQALAINWRRHCASCRSLSVNGSMLTHPGVYCLRSNQTDWDEETLWRTYITLTDLEAVFRSLKSELGLRPIYHHKALRTEGHLFITVIAYQLVQVIRRRLRSTGRVESWSLLPHPEWAATHYRDLGRCMSVKPRSGFTSMETPGDPKDDHLSVKKYLKRARFSIVPEQLFCHPNILIFIKF